MPRQTLPPPPQKFNKDPHQKNINGVSKFGISGETTNIFPFLGEKSTPHLQGKKLHGDTHAHHFQVNQPVVKPQGCSNQFLRPGAVFCWAWQLLASLPNWWGKPNRFGLHWWIWEVFVWVDYIISFAGIWRNYSGLFDMFRLLYRP